MHLSAAEAAAPTDYSYVAEGDAGLPQRGRRNPQAVPTPVAPTPVAPKAVVLIQPSFRDMELFLAAFRAARGLLRSAIVCVAVNIVTLVCSMCPFERIPGVNWYACWFIWMHVASLLFYMLYLGAAIAMRVKVASVEAPSAVATAASCQTCFVVVALGAGLGLGFYIAYFVGLIVKVLAPYCGGWTIAVSVIGALASVFFAIRGIWRAYMVQRRMKEAVAQHPGQARVPVLRV